jgi:hypothetical protein
LTAAARCDPLPEVCASCVLALVVVDSVFKGIDSVRQSLLGQNLLARPGEHFGRWQGLFAMYPAAQSQGQDCLLSSGRARLQ